MAVEADSELKYEPNPKHKEPWQPGRKGSLCPPDITPRRSKELLATSITDGNQRFAVDQGRAFAGRQHAPGRWHGYPVGWKEVPAKVVQQFLESELVTRQDVKRYWHGNEPTT